MYILLHGTAYECKNINYANFQKNTNYDIMQMPTKKTGRYPNFSLRPLETKRSRLTYIFYKKELESMIHNYVNAENGNI